MKRLMLCVALIALPFSPVASAADFSAGHADFTVGQVIAGLRAAYQGQVEAIRQLRAGQVAPVAYKGLDALVGEGLQVLREGGDNALANRLEGEWTQQVVPALLAQSINKELGDHSPLNQWLADFYQTLYSRSSGAVRAVRILTDLNAMNFALSVVFTPKHGSWRTYTAYDRIEYRKHFIPFAKITTYWGSIVVCRRYAPQESSASCDKGATMLEGVMARYVGPVVSDWVFALAGGRASKPQKDFDSLMPSEDDFINHVLASTQGE